MKSSQTMRDLLKAHGLRYSQARDSILSYLHTKNMHITAEGLYHALKAHGEDLSLSTIYLNLGVLSEAGLVRELKGIGEETLFDSNVSEPHYHLVCKRTGKVIDIPALDIEGVPLERYLKEKIEAVTGWQIEEPEISLHGMSPDKD